MTDDRKHVELPEYEEPSMIDLEEVVGGIASPGVCATSGEGKLCDGGCLTSGTSVAGAE